MQSINRFTPSPEKKDLNEMKTTTAPSLAPRFRAQPQEPAAKLKPKSTTLARLTLHHSHALRAALALVLEAAPTASARKLALDDAARALGLPRAQLAYDLLDLAPAALRHTLRAHLLAP